MILLFQLTGLNFFSSEIHIMSFFLKKIKIIFSPEEKKNDSEKIRGKRNKMFVS